MSTTALGQCRGCGRDGVMTVVTCTCCEPPNPDHDDLTCGCLPEEEL